jgi:hypothetical protein
VSKVKCRVARYFLTQYTKTVENYQIATTLPNSLQMYQMAVTYSKLTQNLPTVSTLRPSKIGIFGLKINRLATLVKWAFAKPGNINLFAASVPS